MPAGISGGKIFASENVDQKLRSFVKKLAFLTNVLIIFFSKMYDMYMF